MIELYEKLSSHDAELSALVLKSAGIAHRVKKGAGGWSVWVDERQYAAARRTMAAYFAENQPSDDEAGGESALDVSRHGYAGVWIAAILAAFYFFVEQTGQVKEIWSDFGAAADRIVGGEVFRSVTALMLHADAEHLLGNMAGMALFGTAVCQVTGWGVGVLMIVTTGAAGNLVNAWMYESAHLSIGASTAVFGAVGILSGYQFVRRPRTDRRRSAAWLPLACGLALLGFLGSGAHVDLAAHLFGFAAGIAAGIGYAHRVRQPGSDAVQLFGLVAAFLIVSVSWAVGYY